MGTDINIKVERKQGGNWIESESDRNFYDDRNYDLFSASAGIRHKGVAIATPIFFMPIRQRSCELVDRTFQGHS